MTSKKDLDDCVFDFEGDGEGGFFRVNMTNRDGELNRHVMVNRGDKFQVVATLLDVAHGKMKVGGGDDVTLLVACFRFLPSGGKRFVNANITWTFTSDDPAVDVEVVDMAPEGSWALNPVTLKLETTLGATANIGTGTGPVTSSVGGNYTGKRSKDLEYHTTVDGNMRMEEDRDKGGFNAVRWSLKENGEDARGICRLLQVGVLLRRTVLSGMKPKPGPAPTFRGAVNITVDKGFWRQAKSTAERVYKKVDKDEAIVFRPGADRVSGHFDIDKNSLGDMGLTDDIMYMSLHESFAEIRKERDERKKKKREAEEKKKDEEEEKKEKKKEEEKEEEEKEEKKKKKKQEEENRKARDGGEKPRPAVSAVSVSADTLPQSLPPVWLFYVVLGVLGMYLWQQLMKVLFGGN